MGINFKKAVALKYRAELPAPVVIAKGRGSVANRIIEEANKNNIHIIENQDLTDLLMKVDVGNYIPPELYKAVAEILVYIKKIEEEV